MKRVYSLVSAELIKIYLFFGKSAQQTFNNVKLKKLFITKKYFLLIWKAFQNTEWRFSSWNIFFRFEDILTFFYYAN